MKRKGHDLGVPLVAYYDNRFTVFTGFCNEFVYLFDKRTGRVDIFYSQFFYAVEYRPAFPVRTDDQSSAFGAGVGRRYGHDSFAFKFFKHGAVMDKFSEHTRFRAQIFRYGHRVFNAETKSRAGRNDYIHYFPSFAARYFL